MAPFRVLTVKDVDNFIQFPGTINVNTGNANRTDEEILLTVFKEDVILENYDKSFLVNDYAIYTSVNISDIFNNGMDWKYEVKNAFENGNFVGPRIVDAHDNNINLQSSIINTVTAKTKLGTDAADTRFSHYRQCDRFFKYSFLVGDDVTFGGRTGHVYAVYLDTVTGDAIPYWYSVISGQEAEYLRFYYADLDMHTQYGLTFDGLPVTVVCPPHPDFIASDVVASTANNLVYTRGLDGNLMVRSLGFTAISHPYTEDDFVPFSDDTERELLVYMVVEPDTSKHFQGETIVPLWSSKQISSSWGPIRDIIDASGHRISPVSQDLVKDVDRFTFTRTIVANSFTEAHLAPRMHYPVSRIATRYIENDIPAEMDVVPFAFDLANNAAFSGDTCRSIIGGRIMQLVSTYMFDGCTDAELAFFPFLKSEAKSLTDKIIEYLGAALMSSRDSRNSIIEQIVVKYGRRFFDEMAVYDGVSDTLMGDMWQVLSQIPEYFLFFTATISSTISTRTKDRVDTVQFLEVPIVLRVHA